jgi:putative N-acetylmannosamine-6-phosphate epimerase
MEKRVTDVDCILNEVRQIYNASCEVVLIDHTEKVQEKKFKVEEASV